MYMLHFADTFIHSLLFGSFPFLVIVNNTLINIGVQISDLGFTFNSFVYRHTSGITESYDNSMLNFLRNHHFAFHNSGTILHFHWQCTSVPISPCPCQHLLFSFFFFPNSHPHGCEVLFHCYILIINKSSFWPKFPDVLKKDLEVTIDSFIVKKEYFIRFLTWC